MSHTRGMGGSAAAGDRHVVIVGAGMGGLSSAAGLLAGGPGARPRVTVLERAQAVGGKAHRVPIASGIDGGPTVVTMAEVFEALFTTLGERLSDHVTLTPLSVLARHAWPDGARLDLHADRERTAAEIAQVFGAREAAGYRRFGAYTAAIHAQVRAPFMESTRPSLLSLAAQLAVQGPRAVLRTDFRRSMWQALSEFFATPHLRQLFGRYATYYGSSPFLAPATLNLIADVEARGVWSVDGGVSRLAHALANLLGERGVAIRTGCGVAEILVDAGTVTGVVTDDGEVLRADAVIFNGEPTTLVRGALGQAVTGAVAPTSRTQRSLSAITTCALAEVSGWSLDHHNVCFSSDYAREFEALVTQRRLPDEPTVYVCAQDRTPDRRDKPMWGRDPRVDRGERLLILVNAPADGDSSTDTSRWNEELKRCQDATSALLDRCGLRITAIHQQTTTPRDFEGRFRDSGGALYGPACHSTWAPFQRAATMTKIRGLFVVGGSVHPGAGIPMVTLGGKAAAAATRKHLVRTTPRALPTTSRATAMPGGTSTPSPTTDSTR